ncbi:MAG: hypothetical protein QNJ40_13720 [Xanthomonadales bacterium]|nr:hypothetical protein [Xanthomonadales bacterium]
MNIWKPVSLILPILVALGPRPVAAEDASAITREVWREAVVSVTDLDRSARFFREIGGYQVHWRGPLTRSGIRAWNLADSASGEALLLGPADARDGLLRLVRFDNAGDRSPMRPGSRAWDTGCYFSLMVRMKDMPAIYDDAIALGWWTETPITYLEFGESRLNVMIFRGPDGVQVQGYERLAPPLPDAIPEFERLTRPFNMMQMVRDRDAAYDFFTRVLGFATFYKGKPYTAAEPTHTPLGIPLNLTTTVRYQAGIVYPREGEFGRMEMIEVMDLEGRDHADRCAAPNLGILAVRFPVESADAAAEEIQARGWSLETEPQTVEISPYGQLELFSVRTPDGAIVQFIE